MPLAAVLMISIDDQKICNQTKHVPGQVVVDSSHEDYAFQTYRIVCRDLAALGKAIRERFEDSDVLPNRAQEWIAQLKTSRNDSQSRFARMLPVEIIFHIFSLVIVNQAGNSSSKERPNPSRKASPEKPLCAPVILLGVCRLWRWIALAQPELWTKVWINVNRKPCQITEEWLYRSYPRTLNLTLYAAINANSKPCRLTEEGLNRPYLRVRPLSLTLYGNDLRNQGSLRLAWRKHPGREDFKIPLLFKLLRTHCARWGCINLEKAPPMTLYKLFESLNYPPGRLHPFELQLGSYSDGTSFRSCIPLQPVRFCSASQDFPVSRMPLGWENLTHLELCYSNIDSVLDIIRQAPKLKRCILGSRLIRLRQYFQSWEVEKSIKPFLNKSLEDLTFNGCGTKFFRNITLPSLRYLKYDLDQWNKAYFDDDLRDLGDLLDRSDFDLKSNKTFALAYPHHGSTRDLTYPRYPSRLDLNRIGRQRFAAAVTHLSLNVEPWSYEIVLSFFKGSDTAVFPDLQEIQLNVFRKYEHDGDIRREAWIVPSMGPDICAALCNLITENNSDADLPRNLEKDTNLTSNPTATPVDDAVDQIPQSDTPNAGNPSMNILGRYRRALKSITVFVDCDDTHPPGTIIKMTKDTFLRLREAQKTGPLKLEFEFRTEGNVDLLHDPRCLEDNDGDFVTLKTF